MKTIRRLGPQSKAGRSHYQFKNWSWDKFGKRQAPISVRPLKGKYADLINTCYLNPSKGTETVYCIALDLDAHRAASQWKTKAGKLKWAPIRKLLCEKYPEIFRYVFSVVRSTSGNGLALYVAISPLELVASTKKAQTASKALQEKLMLLFNRHDLGADLSAIGLKRDFCNWMNTEKVEYENLFVMRSVQSEKIPVVNILLDVLKPFHLSSYVKKSDRDGLLYPSIGVERKLAKLYVHLFDEWLDGEKTVSLSVKDIQNLTSLSRPTVEKLLKSPPEWLVTEYYGYSEGWGLSIFLDQELTQRAFELLEHKDFNEQDFSKKLEKPETVQDGDRNRWITQAILSLKHHGTSKDHAITIMERHIENIPGSESSNNCKNFKKIIYSIYSNHQDLFAIKPGTAPRWLLGIEVVGQSLIKKKPAKSTPIEPINLTKSQMQNFFKKGGYPQQSLLRKVSRDQCFIFEKNYYSVPKSYVNRHVLAFRWNGKLRIYEEFTQKHICTHDIVTNNKGTYQTIDSHFEVFGELERQYFSNLVKQFDAEGQYIGLFAKSLVQKYKLFSLRRLWTLRGLIKQFGPKQVDQAAQFSSNLRQLTKNIKYLSEKENFNGNRSQSLSKRILSN